jgi:hypothetical protein
MTATRTFKDQRERLAFNIRQQVKQALGGARIHDKGAVEPLEQALALAEELLAHGWWDEDIRYFHTFIQKAIVATSDMNQASYFEHIYVALREWQRSQS